MTAAILAFLLFACGGGAPGTAGGVAGVRDQAGASSGEAAPASAGLRMREHQVTDPGLNGMVASSFLVPEGWKVEGGITRTAPAAYKNPVLADVKVTAPDGRGVRFFPTMSFEFGDRIQGPLLQPTLGGHFHFPLPDSVGGWILQLARLAPAPGVSGLRVVSETDVPELTAQLREAHAAQYQQARQMSATGGSIGVTQAFDTQATAVEIAYRNQGQAIEETILVAWRYYVNQLHGRTTGGSWSVMQMRSMRGPAGTNHVDDPVLAAILSSVRVNPAWAREMQAFWAELARIEHRGAMDRAAQNRRHQAVMNQYGSDVSDIIHQGWRTRSALNDAGQAAAVDAIHERTPYQLPQGQSVELPSFYQHVYTDGQGHYLLHNDALHDPNLDPAFNDHAWTRVQPAR